MLDNTISLITTASNSLSLDLKRQKTILPDTKQNNKKNQNAKIFQELLNDIRMLDNEIKYKRETMCANEVDDNISTLPSMQINQLLFIKK